MGLTTGFTLSDEKININSISPAVQYQISLYFFGMSPMLFDKQPNKTTVAHTCNTHNSFGKTTLSQPLV